MRPWGAFITAANSLLRRSISALLPLSLTIEKLGDVLLLCKSNSIAKEVCGFFWFC